MEVVLSSPADILRDTSAKQVSGESLLPSKQRHDHRRPRSACSSADPVNCRVLSSVPDWVPEVVSWWV